MGHALGGARSAGGLVLLQAAHGGENQKESRPTAHSARPAQPCWPGAGRSPSPRLRTEQTDTQPHGQTRWHSPVPRDRRRPV